MEKKQSFIAPEELAKTAALMHYHIEECKRLSGMSLAQMAKENREAGVPGYSVLRRERYQNELNAMTNLLRVAGLYDQVNREHWIMYGATMLGSPLWPQGVDDGLQR